MTSDSGTPFLVQADDPSGITDLARELRRLRGLVAGARFDDVADELALTRELADRLERKGRPYPPSEYPSWGVPEHIGSNPAMGQRNPASPPLEPVLLDDGTVRADLRLGIEYQGPPGCVHGGIVALLFDEMLGIANAAAEHIGMTVDLRVTYHAPTPLGDPLRIEARQSRVEGRKIWCEGTLHSGDTLCASVVGMFVTPRWMVDEDQSLPIEG